MYLIPQTKILQTTALGHVWLAVWLCKYSLVGTQPHPLAYLLPMAGFKLRGKMGYGSCTINPIVSKTQIFTLCPFTEKIVLPPHINHSIWSTAFKYTNKQKINRDFKSVCLPFLFPSFYSSFFLSFLPFILSCCLSLLFLIFFLLPYDK